MADIVTATDEIHAVVTDAWKAGADDIAGGETMLLCTLVTGDAVPLKNGQPFGGVWARVTVRDNDADTFALGRKYQNSGTLFVNVFVPKSEAAGTKAQKLAQLVASAIRKHIAGAVTFSRVRPQWVGQNAGTFQYDVLADYSWNEARGA